MNKQAWIDAALQNGWECFEVYQSGQQEKTLNWFDGQMDSFVTSRVTGTALRGIIQGKMANLSSEDISDDDMTRILNQMLEQAQTITTDQEDQLRQPEDCIEIVRQDHWVQPDMEEVKELMIRLEQAIKDYDPRIVQVAGMEWKQATGTREMINSYGVEIKDEDRVHYLMASVVVSDHDVVKDAYQIEVIKDLKDFDETAFVSKLCDKALFKLDAKPLQTMQTPVIFEREAMMSLLSAFMGLFNGELIFKGISPLQGKLDTSIFSEKVTLVDDPRHPDALTIANYDDEGCPTRRKVLVNKGVFTQMLHNTKSAIRMHAQSTGNGFKAGYAAAPSVTPMNTYIEPGQRSLEEMCETMKDGLVITDLQGLHAGIDFVSTNFSLQCAGYLVKDGKKDHAVSMITVAGNFMELMNQIEEIGNDLEWEYHSIVAPSIRFTQCSISGE